MAKRGRQLDMFGDAREVRDAALALLEENRAAWLARARAEALALWNERHAPITVNDVRRRCPPPDGIDPRVMGAIFHSRDWEPCGYEQSDRRTCHARPIRLFRPSEGV